MSHAACSARLPGSTVALFSTLQPLFTGILGLVGSSSPATASVRAAAPPSAYPPAPSVLGEGVSLQAGLGGGAIVMGKCPPLQRAGGRMVFGRQPLLTACVRPGDMLLQSATHASAAQLAREAQHAGAVAGIGCGVG